MELPMSKLISLLLLICVGTSAGSGWAAAADQTPRGYVRSRHVVEIVDASSFGVRFIINGHPFTPVSGACSGWAAGDGVSLISGDWHGYCADAVFRNTKRGRTCEALCNTW
jgi:hypothetical protein